MSTELILDWVGQGSDTAGIVLAVGLGLKAVSSVCRSWIEQSSRTRRLSKALEGAPPKRRAKIIRACRHIEEGRAE